jgi:hypothetical protein
MMDKGANAARHLGAAQMDRVDAATNGAALRVEGGLINAMA